MADNNEEMASISLAIKKNQIKITVTFYPSPVIMAIIKQTKAGASEEVSKKCPHILLG
jgi:hypothetical protein